MIYIYNYKYFFVFGGFVGRLARLCRLQATMRQGQNPDIA